MKLLIDIPDWLYNDICNHGIKNRNHPELYWAIYNGKIIPTENVKDLVEENKED